MHCTICTICTLEGESAKSAESAKQKNDMAKLTKLANFRQNFVKIAKIVMQIFIEPAKSEEDFLYLSKMTKNDSKIIFFDICKYFIKILRF